MEALLLNTDDNPHDLASQGFSGSWKLNPKRAIGCDYIVICALGKRTGVLVGKMRGLMRREDSSRFDVYFSEFAEIDIPDVWTTKSQNPIGYSKTADLQIDFESLEYQRVRSSLNSMD